MTFIQAYQRTMRDVECQLYREHTSAKAADVTNLLLSDTFTITLRIVDVRLTCLINITYLLTYLLAYCHRYFYPHYRKYAARHLNDDHDDDDHNNNTSYMAKNVG